jgi:hypothetical protein
LPHAIAVIESPELAALVPPPGTSEDAPTCRFPATRPAVLLASIAPVVNGEKLTTPTAALEPTTLSFHVPLAARATKSCPPWAESRRLRRPSALPTEGSGGKTWAFTFCVLRDRGFSLRRTLNANFQTFESSAPFHRILMADYIR